MILLASVAVAGFGAGMSSSQRSGLQSNLIAPSASQIISFDETIGMLDTTSGAIYRLRGNLDNPGAKLTWEMRVSPVTEANSGMLELQRPTFNAPGTHFLVDQITGDTWVLRRRASENGAWVPVTIFR